ncbi:unnamed protein product [Symbiodinium sp. KB8]|nr:unnamed protein product [Symbiodinium sp. KB8]
MGTPWRASKGVSDGAVAPARLEVTTGRTSRPKSEEDHWAAAGAFDHAKDPKPTKTEANAASVTVLQSRTVVRQADVQAFVASSKRALARLVQAVPSLTAAELRVGGQADSEGNVEVQSHTTWAGEPAMHSLPEDPLLTAWLADMAQFMKQRPEVSSFTQEVIIPER